MTNIFGHDHVVRDFLATMHSGRLHHAWLFMGKEGLGKATAARKFAIRMLAGAVDQSLDPLSLDVPDECATVRMMAAGSHPDFRLLERLPKDEKLRDKPKAEWPEPLELARNINVDQIRRLNASFATAPSLSQRRVVIIDAIDSLERGAANALLKTLEEPPKGTIFFLICHAPGRLLPTIRSRCRTLRFNPVSGDAMTSFLSEMMPELEYTARGAIIDASEGTPGKAIQAAKFDIAGIEAALEELSQSGDPGNNIRVKMSKMLAGKAAQGRYEYLLSRVPQFIAACARAHQGPGGDRIIDEWDAARHLAQNAVHASLDPQAVVFALAGHVAALAPLVGAAKA
jgi:DNA polymerase III subunit delta'